MRFAITVLTYVDRNSQVKSLQEERQGLQKEVRCVIFIAPKHLASAPSHNWRINSRKINNDKAWAKDYVEGQGLKGLNLDHASRVPPHGLDPQFNCTPSHASPLHNCTVSTRSDNIYLFLEKTHLLLSISRLLFPPYMKKVESRRVLQITWLLIQMWSQILHHVWKSKDFKVILLIHWYCVKVNWYYSTASNTTPRL